MAEGLGDPAQTEGLLGVTHRATQLREVHPSVERLSVGRDPVDDDVDVLVAGVVVNEDRGLVVGEAELFEHPVGDLLPFVGGEDLARGRGGADVVDRQLDVGASLLGQTRHQVAGGEGLVDG